MQSQFSTRPWAWVKPSLVGSALGPSMVVLADPIGGHPLSNHVWANVAMWLTGFSVTMLAAAAFAYWDHVQARRTSKELR
jgi:hypothetical protein